MFPGKKRRVMKHRRRAVAAVEFAMIAPLMILFTFALVEIGRFMLVKETATHASREGARVAVRPMATVDQVVTRVNEELAIMSISDATVTVNPPQLEDAEPGSMVTVTIEVAPDSISWASGVFDIDVAQIVAESTMRRESTN